MAMTAKYVTVTGAGAKTGADAANAWDWATMLTSAAVGDDVLVQEGTYSLAASSAFTNAGTSTSPIRLRGAKTDWTPLAPTRTNAGALSTTNMPVIAYDNGYGLTQRTFCIFHGLKITANQDAPAVQLGSSGVIVSCVVENANNGSSAIGISSSSNCVIYDNDATMTAANGGGTNGAAISCSANSRVLQNRISSGVTANASVLIVGSGGVVAGNVIYAGKSHGIVFESTARVCAVLWNTFANSAAGGTSDGINVINGSTSLQCVVGNLITDCTRYGINGVSAANAVFSAMNRIDRATSGAHNSATDWLASTKFGDDVTSITQANEYENAGANDYRLKSTSPAIEKGPWMLGDIGALQAEAAGGGSSEHSHVFVG